MTLRAIRLFLLIFFLQTRILQGQGVYKIDASEVMQVPITGLFKMGNPCTTDKAILVNSLYLTRGGKPMLPVMGEMHFSRIRVDQWEDRILKMKACGITIISTYLFWNHHEEIENQFDWEGEKNLRAFVLLCAKHGLYVIARLGPWSHGEARNGGTPDWILRKKFIKDRSDDVVYRDYVKKYFARIANQLDGLYYKDGGNVIGVQLENEYWYAKQGEAHIRWLKNTAISLGIDVPIYTVTGWGNGSVPPFEVIPLWGAYADAPWTEHTEKVYQPENFMFDPFRDNKHIGNDRTTSSNEYMTYEKYPYFTCEIGVGVQNTYHRRLAINPIDGLGMMTAKLGSGSNLLGYYIFTGATQFRGQLHSTEEEQEETGYWSRVPEKSYDFQAAIRESGEISEAYKEIKKLHYFVGETGEKLATMLPVLMPGSKDGLQVAVRSDNQSGFLFGINYARYAPKETRKNCRFQVKFKNETLAFPQNGIDIPDSSIFIWPLNYDLGGTRLTYATAQLLGKAGNTYLFFQNSGIPVEMAFDPSTFEKLEAPGTSIQIKNGMSIVSGLHPAQQCAITLTLKNGTTQQIVVLSGQDAKNCWILDHKGKKECFITNNGMYADTENIYIYSDKPAMTVSRLNPGSPDLFSNVNVGTAEEKKQSVTIVPHPLLTGAEWLETANFKEIQPYQQRYHRFFFKEFSLDNPSGIKKATLYIFPETDGTLNLNQMWVRQPVKAGVLNVIDLTGYVVKGENMLFAGFPYTAGLKRFAARMDVEYSNYDHVGFVTDTSWVTLDSYTNPTLLKPYDHPVTPVVAKTPDFAGSISYPGFREWDISVPYSIPGHIRDIYLKLRYTGDRAELFNGYTLSADNFNDNRTWSIGLHSQERTVEGKNLRLVIYPLSKGTKVFFDTPPGDDTYGTAKIIDFEAIPEYQSIIQ
jgi:hypothetical protein